MKQPQLGKKLCLALVLLLSSCRTDQPPKLSLICIGDGLGGADCVDGAGAKIYKTPSQLKGFWMTTEVDESNFSTWCYGGDVKPQVEKAMAETKEEILNGSSFSQN